MIRAGGQADATDDSSESGGRKPRWRAPGPVYQGLIAFAIYLVSMIFGLAQPLLPHLDVPHVQQTQVDANFYIWAISWWPYAITHGLNPLFSHQIMAPGGVNLAWATTTPTRVPAHVADHGHGGPDRGVQPVADPRPAGLGLGDLHPCPPADRQVLASAVRGIRLRLLRLRDLPRGLGPAEPHGNPADPAHRLPRPAVVGRVAWPARFPDLDGTRPRRGVLHLPRGLRRPDPGRAHRPGHRLTWSRRGTRGPRWSGWPWTA